MPGVCVSKSPELRTLKLTMTEKMKSKDEQDSVVHTLQSAQLTPLTACRVDINFHSSIHASYIYIYIYIYIYDAFYVFVCHYYSSVA